MNLPYDKVKQITQLAKRELNCRYGGGYWNNSDWIFEYIEIFMTLYMQEYTVNLQQSVMMKPSINYLPSPLLSIQLTDEQIKNLEIE